MTHTGASEVATLRNIFCEPLPVEDIVDAAEAVVDIAQRYPACRVYLVFNSVCLMVPPDSNAWQIAADYHEALNWKSKRRRKRWLFWRRP